MLSGMDIDSRAVALPGQDAVLFFAHVGDLTHQPDADSREHDGEHERSKVDQHAVPVIVLPVGALVSAEILEGWASRLGRPKLPLQSRSRPPEWYHPRAVIIRLRTVEFHGGSPGVFAQVFYRRSRPRFQAKPFGCGGELDPLGAADPNGAVPIDLRKAAGVPLAEYGDFRVNSWEIHVNEMGPRSQGHL
jgi:hypothetical protein